jgi:DNA repair protein RecN (Recombination protein N)
MMLRELFIQNIAIIDNLALKLHPGLNIITGETGAGKSVIIGSLGLLLGFRGSSDVIRSGCDKAFVTGAFEIDSLFYEKLSRYGIPDLEDGILTLSREISREGRNLCRINEKIFSLSAFKAVGSLLIDIYGQNEERGLLVPSNQLDILDQFGGDRLIEWKKAAGECFRNLASLEQKIEEAKLRQEEIREKTDFLQYQLNELVDADLQDKDEEQHLEEEIRILSGAESLVQNSLEIYGLLFGFDQEESSAYDKVSRSLGILEKMKTIDPSLGEKEEIIKNTLYSLEEVSDFFRTYADSVESDPQRLEMLQDRLTLLRKLEDKYKKSIEELISFRDEIASTLENQSISQYKIEEMEKEKNNLLNKYMEAAGTLTKLRKETADFLSQQVSAILKELEMKDSRFQVIFSQKEFSDNGMDEVQFVFSANKGEPLKPLQKVASGGELSRLMLSLKSVLAEVDSLPVLVFDEADTGIGGEAARKVGLLISKLASARQVICVTHSAQVAVFADRHFLISKRTSNDRTTSDIQILSYEDRLAEIARMLGGQGLDTGIKHAEKMLEEAGNERA